MKVNAGILLDLGNSETRVSLISGGQVKDFTLSNKFAAMNTGYVVADKYVNDKSTVFLHGMTYYANGYILEMEFKNEAVYPNALDNKTKQVTTKLSVSLAFIKALGELAKQYSVPVSELDVTFKVSVLQPPLEHELCEKDMEEIVKSITSVTTKVPTEMSVNFEIESVSVRPEGVAAYFGVVFQDVNGVATTVPTNEPFLSGYTLVLDIGAGTTDMVLIKDGELVQGSKSTLRKGGNTVESYLKKEIKKKFGYAPTMMHSIIESAMLPDGNTSHDIADLLTASKRFYSTSVRNDIIDYIQENMIEMREIKGILVVGGGSLATVRDNKTVSPAMSDVLIEYLKELAPNISIISTLEKNPRLLNMEGLKLMHKFQ